MVDIIVKLVIFLFTGNIYLLFPVTECHHQPEESIPKPCVSDEL